MTTAFLLCAIAGTVVLLGQIVLGMFVGHDGDGPAADLSIEHGDHGLFGILSIRSISAGLAGFGIAGMIAHSAGQPQVVQLLAAVVGAAAMFGVVVAVFRMLLKLTASGNVKLENAVDQIGEVYVNIPPEYKGEGKIQIDLQNRTIELAAVTFGPALSTGMRVRVVQIVGPQTVEVIAAPQEGNVA